MQEIAFDKNQVTLWNLEEYECKFLCTCNTHDI